MRVRSINLFHEFRFPIFHESVLEELRKKKEWKRKIK